MGSIRFVQSAESSRCRKSQWVNYDEWMGCHELGYFFEDEWVNVEGGIGGLLQRPVLMTAIINDRGMDGHQSSRTNSKFSSLVNFLLFFFLSPPLLLLFSPHFFAVPYFFASSLFSVRPSLPISHLSPFFILSSVSICTLLCTELCLTICQSVYEFDSFLPLNLSYDHQ